MRTKLFIGAALAVVLAVVATAAFAGVFTEANPATPPEPGNAAQSSPQSQTCCTSDDCCPECILCCSLDGCCEECILCCILMGCDPSCCFPALTRAKAEAPTTASACCTDSKPAPKAKASCGDGCCK